MAGDGPPTEPDQPTDAELALACFGLQPAAPLARPLQHCEVWPEHVQALDLLQACASQWQPLVSGMGGVWWRGAQWVNVAQAMQFMQVPRKAQPELWRQYRIMEQEAIDILQAQAHKAAKT